MGALEEKSAEFILWGQWMFEHFMEIHPVIEIFQWIKGLRQSINHQTLPSFKSSASTAEANSSQFWESLSL